MFANKLKHNRPVFTAVRGAVAWVVMVGIWFVYPSVQRASYPPNATNEQQERLAPSATTDDELTTGVNRTEEASAVVEVHASF